MSIWELDFYRRPLQDEAGNALWELLICDRQGNLQHSFFCAQSQATADWLRQQLQQLLTDGHPKPERICVFRPQSFSLLETAAQPLGIEVEPTRHTPTLKRLLEERSLVYPTYPYYTSQPYQPVALDKPPPLPVSENLLGVQWRFASLPAGDLIPAFSDRLIPILNMPPEILPLSLGLASTVLISGVVIDGGRRSMQLARWLEKICPVSLSYIPGTPDGLILEAGLVDRWVMATFDDAEMAIAAQTYEVRKQLGKGLHFLLIQPDDSGMTYTALWLLKQE
ncbi:Tab2/Atab2 family RNA-binding protein [Phormidium sp. CLA17]|uniref:Tab2/Atab2 family RNA-binding protein n=1 Tax=Leptolyngbya sp. Cla-17 TaxID=2803751 RepID=UPI001491F4E6|nr:Tab2/Atab2 family RNA-binding protein [Leptolyngbya sp. Cla-17]MBM0742811.1 Tab2/Atab2 family RNA-binding protein [Leptolyngbya sp. Cla-17]